MDNKKAVIIPDLLEKIDRIGSIQANIDDLYKKIDTVERKLDSIMDIMDKNIIDYNYLVNIIEEMRKFISESKALITKEY